MENNNSLLFGNVVKNMNNFILPNPMANSIESIPIIITDRLLGDNNIRSLTPVFTPLPDQGGRGFLKIEGPEWNSFVRDRGIRAGDVLLMKLVHQISPIINMIINVTVIRLDRRSNRALIPPLPPPPQIDQQRSSSSFLCVKKLDEAEIGIDRIQMPREIGEGIRSHGDLIDLKEDRFEVVVKDQTVENIEILTKLKLRSESDDDGEIFLGDDWLKIVDDRGLRAGDLIVFCFDVDRRIITMNVYRSHQQHDFFIPFQPQAILNSELVYV
ncbi:hypothetical protein CsatB_002359 [Cannabis sativa]